METHHPKNVTHKKKWTEYLLEFFMLFLAVFLGFIAENIREHSVERHREREYIIGMVQNLKDDTTQLNKAIPFLTSIEQKLDSIVHMSKTDLTVPENLKTITRIQLGSVLFYTTFKSNNATVAQLKTGNLRLIQTGHVADSILKYDYLSTRAETQWQESRIIYNEWLAKSSDVFDLSIASDTSYIKNRQILDKLPPPLTMDKEKLRLYFNQAEIHLVGTRSYLGWLNSLSKYANQLIEFLKQQYDLKDE